MTPESLNGLPPLLQWAVFVLAAIFISAATAISYFKNLRRETATPTLGLDDKAFDSLVDALDRNTASQNRQTEMLQSATQKAGELTDAIERQRRIMAEAGIQPRDDEILRLLRELAKRP